MKKYLTLIVSILIILFFACCYFIEVNKKNNNELRKITVAEVTHSLFYSPFYSAIANGYFEDEGIEIDLLLTPGADSVMASVLSGDADIGLSGSEATIYIYNSGEKDYIKTFAQLTQKDGSFIVSRNDIENFTLNDLKGKYIIGGRVGNLIRSYNTGLFFKALCLVLNSFKYSSGFLIFNFIVISLLLLIIILSIKLANKNLLGFLMLKYS